MTRRGLLGLLASLPFVGGLFIAAEAKPTVAIRTVYGRIGEKVTCENGHHIFTFRETAYLGEPQDPKRHFGNWQQPEPVIGQIPIPSCAKCGAPWTDGMVYHFEDGWRDPLGYHAALIAQKANG